MENSESLDNLKTFMKIVGTPFNNKKDIILDETASRNLYEFAQNNKLGFLFLKSLSEYQDIGKLKKELETQNKNYGILQETASRIGNILNNSNSGYVMIKSHFLFPVIPSDIDMLIFGNKKDYDDAITQMTDNQFTPVEDPTPLQACLHDSSRGPHVNDPSKWHASKDPFDTDIYRNIGAGHVVYMNKSKLQSEITSISMNNVKVNILTPAADLPLSIFHTIFPEKIFTLLIHLHILYTIYQMDEKDIKEFVIISKNERMKYAICHALSISELVQEYCFGEVPKKISEVREYFGKRHIVNLNKMPYNYNSSVVSKSFWEKRTDPLFRKSFFRQLFAMLNPKYGKYVIHVMSDRVSRDTY